MRYSSLVRVFVVCVTVGLFSACSTPEQEMGLTVENPDPGVVITMGHEVGDYDFWRENFSKHDSLRSQFGIEVQTILHGEDAPELVWVVSTAPTAEAAEAFLTDVGTARTMETDGVVGEVYRAILDNGYVAPVDASMYPERLIVQHQVKDFNEWKKVFDGHIGSRDRMGIVDLFVSHPVYDSTDVHLMFGIRDTNEAMGYMTSDALRIAMKLSGVIGEPRAYFVRVAE